METKEQSTTTPTKPITWSYSALTRFLQCAKQYHHLNVLKDFKDIETEISLWGHRVHGFFAKGLEHPELLDGETGEFQSFIPIIRRFSEIKGELYVEQRVAINRSFKQVEYWAKDVWCRGVLDAVWVNGDVAKIADWKTGRRKVDLTQLKLFALLIFCIYPEVQRVSTAFCWLQTGKMDVEKFGREDIPALWNDLLPDVRRLEMAYKNDQWVPKPSGLCKNNWCPVKSCSFWQGK